MDEVMDNVPQAENTEPETEGIQKKEYAVDSIKDVISDDRERKQRNFTFTQVIMGDILVKSWLLRQKWLFLEIIVLVLIYITIRYSVQEDIVECARLEQAYEKAKNKAMTSSSQLTEISRQSKIEETLKSIGDSTLSAPETPPVTINLNNAKQEDEQ